MQGNHKVLEEKDAILVARYYMKHEGCGLKPSIEDIKQQADLLDIELGSELMSLRSNLISFGNELVKNSFVSLKKKGGLTTEDIEIL